MRYFSTSLLSLYNKVVCIVFYKVTALTEEDLQIKHINTTYKTISTMSLIVTLLVVTLVTQCWSGPQRINWTPQAILYLKGAQRHRSVLERTSREDGDASHSVTHSQSSDGRRLSLASSTLLELLQRAAEEDEGNYQDDQELNLNYL